jgi:1-deoxy-D-xylulose-5-phosphate reductoisomerase
LKSEAKHIAILGSTGSIGTQALEVIKSHPDNFSVEVLTANGNADLLIKQAIEFKPNCVVIADENKYQKVKETLSKYDIKVFTGNRSIEQVVQMDSVDMVLTAIVGYAGLASTLSAIRAKKQIALANKETLVVAGELVTALAKENAVNIYPVDSEHSAIFQCLVGEWNNPIEKIILTASGGPFRGKDQKFLSAVTKEQALKHPNWDMGAKITIDSATLMNKGLELIEAKWLFHLKPEQMEVIIHPQSIIHSIVQFRDGSMKAQMGLPDMKLPIQYALSYPNRLPSTFERFNFLNYPNLSFEQPDTKTFRCLPLAFDAMKKGGNAACVLNAANEIAVNAFLTDKISFLKIAEVIERTLEKVSFIQKPTYDDFVSSDNESRIVANEYIDKLMPTMRIDANAAGAVNIMQTMRIDANAAGTDNIMPTTRTNANATNKDKEDSENDQSHDIIHKELSYKINGILFKVHDELGRYAKEKQYGDLFAMHLEKEKINFTREKNISRTSVDNNRADFIIENSIVVEFKAKSFITKEDYYQVKRYLEIINLKLGIIANFRQKFLKPKRVLNSKSQS